MSVTEVIHLPTPVPVQHASTALAAASAVPAVSTSPTPSGNLSQQAAKTYQVLQGGAGFPPSSDPTFVLPPDGRGFIQLFNTIQAIAVEHVYPAPIFSFNA